MLLGDGAVQFLSQNINNTTFVLLSQISDGQVVVSSKIPADKTGCRRFRNRDISSSS